jgi:hypothetical protein
VLGIETTEQINRNQVLAGILGPATTVTSQGVQNIPVQSIIGLQVLL